MAAARDTNIMEDDTLFNEYKLDAELEGFLSGTGTTMVNLSLPGPSSLGSSMEDGLGGGSAKSEDASTSSTAKVAQAAAGLAGKAAAALMGNKFSGMFGDVVGTMAVATVPTSLQPMKETTAKFLNKAQPWKDFFLPLSIPPAAEGCSRLTANIYNFQTNYAILFVLQLVLSVVMQPSALITMVLTVAVWMLFLKKNDDPEWAPELGGMKLGPIQRWLLLAAVTAIALLFVAGGTILNAALTYLFFAFVHGVVHDCSAKGAPGTSQEPPVDL